MGFEFIADRPALDFIATIEERGTTNVEHLQSAADLTEWVRQSGIIDNRLVLSEPDLARAKAVREALYSVLTALIDDTPARPRDRRLLNTLAGRPGPRLQLGPRGQVHCTGNLEAVLAALAHDVLHLHNSPDRHALRRCADPHCTRLFIDRSRGHRRRWCGMRGCGDRAKAAAYRQRQRDTTAALKIAITPGPSGI